MSMVGWISVDLCSTDNRPSLLRFAWQSLHARQKDFIALIKSLQRSLQQSHIHWALWQSLISSSTMAAMSPNRTNRHLQSHRNPDTPTAPKLLRLKRPYWTEALCLRVMAQVSNAEIYGVTCLLVLQEAKINKSDFFSELKRSVAEAQVIHRHSLREFPTMI